MQGNIECNPILNPDNKRIGVIFTIYQLDRNYAFVVGCKWYTDHEVWWCKQRTPNSSIFVDPKIMDKVINQYHLTERMKEYKDGE